MNGNGWKWMPAFSVHTRVNYIRTENVFASKTVAIQSVHPQDFQMLIQWRVSECDSQRPHGFLSKRNDLTQYISIYGNSKMMSFIQRRTKKEMNENCLSPSVSARLNPITFTVSIELSQVFWAPQRHLTLLKYDSVDVIVSVCRRRCRCSLVIFTISTSILMISKCIWFDALNLLPQEPIISSILRPFLSPSVFYISLSFSLSFSVFIIIHCTSIFQHQLLFVSNKFIRTHNRISLSLSQFYPLLCHA